MPEISGKHRKSPTRDETTSKVNCKVGRRNQANSNNIAQVMTVIYADNVFILVTDSPLNQAQKV